ncbi:MAG: S8 family serine peptidase [Phycisphaerales bacterium]|nr:S8 family serine peptidase [Phycisphaerales bacterium]
MKTIFLILLFLAVFVSLDTNAQTQYAFRISFTDKKATSFSLTSPSAYLSSKALNRRTLQTISIDSNDLPVCDKYVDSVLKLSNAILHTRSRWQNNCVILVNDTTNIALVRNVSFVKKTQYVAVFTSPLHLFKAKEMGNSETNTNGSLWRTTGGVGYYGDAYDQIAIANGYVLHDKGFRGAGKIIAVLDEGYNLVNTLPGFDSLRKTGRIVDTYNFNLDTSDVYGYSGHGTEVLSTMAGILNGSYVGTAPDAQYALYITENGTSEQPFEMDNLVAGMERADSIGADVITISLGYNTFSIGGLIADLSLSAINGKSTIAAMGANTATQKGILVVASAGNEGATSWNKILTPGDADSALTCGSVDVNKTHASTSGNGPNAAGLLKPDVSMMGAPGIVFNTSGTTSAVGGTSIATPQLAGLAACLWATKPTATPYQLRKVIKESAHIASSPNNQLGYGVPDFGKASLSLTEWTALENGLKVAPNPFTNKINVALKDDSNATVEWHILDLLGKTILKGTEYSTPSAYNFEIRMPENLPSGLYVLSVLVGGKAQKLKLLRL